MKIVGYLRVSTARQGVSGLGLEAQSRAIKDFSTTSNADLMETFTEIESGKKDHRPELEKALHLAKITGSTVVIAKLDRLSRNASFLLKLQDSGVKFIAADMPDANNLTVGIMSLVAQQEREAISKRTKEALQAAKKRGVKLGNPNGSAPLKKAAKGNTAALESIKRKANDHALNLKPVIDHLANKNITSLGAIADELNNRGMLTPRNAQWHKTSVKNLLLRIEELT